MRGIADQRHAWGTIPSVTNRQRVDRSHDRCRVALGDQCGESRCPPVEFGCYPHFGGYGVVEVDLRKPRRRSHQLYVGVEHATRLPVRGDPLARFEREHPAGPDRRSGCREPPIGVMQVGLNEGHADIGGLRVRYQRSHLRPSAIGADEQFGLHSRAIGESQPVTAGAKSPGSGELPPPPDRPGWQGINQDPPQVTPEHLRTHAVSALVEQHIAVSVERAGRVAAIVNDCAEGVHQAGGSECALTVMYVNVKLAALCAGLRGGLCFIDRGRDAVDVEDAGEGQPSQACPNDGNGSGHGGAFRWVGTLFHIAGIGTTFQMCHGGHMSKRDHQTARRPDALSKPRIVEAAIEILDTRGEAALTFRALATQLATGSGAIYWHIADRNDLLSAATGDVLARALAKVVREENPRVAIRTIALAVFDAIDAHPWAGSHLSREPWHSAVGEIFERIGEWLQPLGVPLDAQFDCASALTNYILGVSGQNAANARMLPGGTDRKAWLEAMAADWIQDDPESRPFLRRLAAQLSEHDDRQQFLAGIDFILAGACVQQNA